jgi:hypothetical protein
MPVAVTLVDAGGFPITEVSYGLPMTPVASGGYPVTVVVSGGIPVTLVTDTLAPYEDPETEVALTLTWTSGTGTLTPTFTLSGAILVDDVITLSIYSDSGLTTLVDSDSNPVDAAEVLAGTLDFPGIGALSAGTYWAVATLAATGRTGTSNTETKTLAAFDPVSLFSGGEKGFWLDASDLTTLWQDTGGTSAITADGQTVKRWADKSGQSHAFTQATNGPTYNTGSGKHWLTFDGTNDTLTEAASNMTSNIAAATLFLVIEASSPPASDRTIFSILDFSYANRVGAKMTGTFGRINLSGSNVDGSANAMNGSADRSGSPHIAVIELDYANGDAFLYNGSTLDNSSTTFFTNGNTPANNGNGSFIGAEEGTSNFFPGKIYQILFINRLLTGTEKTNLGAYMATKSGATY